MGGLWADYEKSSDGGLKAGSPLNQMTNIPGLYALGECDYQYHGANRLGANSLLSCIFSGLISGPGVQNFINSQKTAAADLPVSLFERAVSREEARHSRLLSGSGRGPSGGENPYLIHQELGIWMTRAATVVRHNAQLDEAYAKISELHERSKYCSLSDVGNWTNQNVIFTKALQDMFPLAKTILKGARMRDECRGAHYKPEFEMPPLKAAESTERRQEAERWCDRFEANNSQYLKTTIAKWNGEHPDITYEDVDTSLVPPRPRLYGLVGAEVIEEVWKERVARNKEKDKDKEKSSKPTTASAKVTA
jgi:succinate dehydrogenase / fumarate reductase flavoprotein subunit